MGSMTPIAMAIYFTMNHFDVIPLPWDSLVLDPSYTYGHISDSKDYVEHLPLC